MKSFLINADLVSDKNGDDGDDHETQEQYLKLIYYKNKYLQHQARAMNFHDTKQNKNERITEILEP